MKSLISHFLPLQNITKVLKKHLKTEERKKKTTEEEMGLKMKERSRKGGFVAILVLVFCCFFENMSKPKVSSPSRYKYIIMFN